MNGQVGEKMLILKWGEKNLKTLLLFRQSKKTSSSRWEGKLRAEKTNKSELPFSTINYMTMMTRDENKKRNNIDAMMNQVYVSVKEKEKKNNVGDHRARVFQKERNRLHWLIHPPKNKGSDKHVAMKSPNKV